MVIRILKTNTDLDSNLKTMAVSLCEQITERDDAIEFQPVSGNLIPLVRLLMQFKIEYELTHES